MVNNRRPQEFKKPTRFLCAGQKAKKMSSGTTSGSTAPSGGLGTSAPAPASSTTFSLTPAQAVGSTIDYSTTEGQKLYKAATAALAEEKFGLEAADLKVFLETLSDRAFEHDFSPVLEVPEDADDLTSAKHNLISHHGKLSLAQVEKHVKKYATAQTRQAQVSVQLYALLMNSLTKKAIQHVSLHRKEYTIDGVRAGAALLKIII